jgi:hypothetical protein
MSDIEQIRYVCNTCGYTNVWTRDEIMQRGERVIYKGDHEEIFSLPCKNPNLPCHERTRVAVPVEGE